MRQTTVLPSQEDFDWLQKLVNLSNNPDLIPKAAEEVRKQNQLTKEQEDKANEARELIRNHARLVSELDQQKTAIVANQKLNEKTASDLKAKREGFDHEYSVFQGMKSTHEKAAKDLNADKEKFAESVAKFEAEKEAFEADKKALADERAALKAKHDRLRQAVE